MTEWVLQPEQQEALHRLTQSPRDHDDDFNRLAKFARGGFWRNFRVKYPESNEMYTRMLEISSRVARLATAAGSTDAGNGTPVDAERLHDIRQSLYRAQCNCSYWHGAFGGLYLPHLRNAVYANLIDADTQLERLRHDSPEWIDVSTGDYNVDAREEIRISNHRLAAYVSPATGGHLYELDVRACRINLLATLNRRPEPYHQRVIEHAERLRNGTADSNQEVASIHDLVRFKQPDLDKKIAYDNWPRKSLVDHFLQPDLAGEAFQRGEGLISDFATSAYAANVRRNDNEVEVELTCEGAIGDHSAQVRKILTMSRLRPGELLVRYEITGLPEGFVGHFGTEFNFAAMPGGASDRYSYGADGQQLGTLDAFVQQDNTTRLGLVDEWLGLDASLEWTEDGSVWAFPIETISQSESGFELVHQSVVVVPHWQFTALADQPWSVDLRLTLDTSLARARELTEVGERIRASDVESSAEHQSVETG